MISTVSSWGQSHQPLHMAAIRAWAQECPVSTSVLHPLACMATGCTSGVSHHAAGPVAPVWCWHLLEGELQMQRCSGHCWYTQHQLQGLITAQQLLQLSAFSRGLMEMVAFRLLWSLCVPQFPLCTCASVAPIAHDGSGATVVMLSSSSLLVTVMHSSSIFFLFSDEYGLGREAFRCDTHHLQS